MLIISFQYVECLFVHVASSFFNVFLFISTTEAMISTTPIHCSRLTSSFSNHQAMQTDTGISIAISIDPSPIPVLGKPMLNNKGGSRVPDIASQIPHSRKTAPLNVLGICTHNIISTMAVAPAKFQKLLTCECKCSAIRVLTKIDIVYTTAAASPHKTPRTSSWL